MSLLDPKNLQLQIAPDATIRATVAGDRCGLNVQIMRAMPMSAPNEFIVIRDGGGKELGVVAAIRDFDSAQRKIVEDALENRYFLPQILQINSIQERFGSAIWEVETDRGPTTINTKALHEAITELSPNRFLLRDTEENRFEIPDVDKLDENSRLKFAGKF